MAKIKPKYNLSSKPRSIIRNGRVIKVDDDSELYLDSLEMQAIDEREIETELEQVKFDNMDKDAILVEIQKVDKELLRINARMSRNHRNQRGLLKSDADTLNLQLKTLKQRSDMLFKCLDKVVPDKRETKVDMTFRTTEVDQIPDDILLKISLGTITEAEYEHYKHLFEKSEKQEKENKVHH